MLKFIIHPEQTHINLSQILSYLDFVTNRKVRLCFYPLHVAPHRFEIETGPIEEKNAFFAIVLKTNFTLYCQDLRNKNIKSTFGIGQICQKILNYYSKKKRKLFRICQYTFSSFRSKNSLTTPFRIHSSSWYIRSVAPMLNVQKIGQNGLTQSEKEIETTPNRIYMNSTAK